MNDTDGSNVQYNACASIASNESNKSEQDPNENWKNKNPEKKHIVKHTRRAHFSILNPQQNVDGRVPILKNGHTNGNISTSNTCCFDSIFSVYATLYTDGYLQQPNVPNLFFDFIKRTFQKGSRNVYQQIYNDHNVLLNKIYSSSSLKKSVTCIKNCTDINCMAGVGELFSAMCKGDCKTLASLIVSRKCHCNEREEIVRPLISTNPRNLNLNQLTKNLNILNEFEFTKMCKGCKTFKVVTFEYSNILAVEVEPISRSQVGCTCISEISPQITIEKINYSLYGVIEHVHQAAHFIEKVAIGKYSTTYVRTKLLCLTKTLPIKVFVHFSCSILSLKTKNTHCS